jgi:UDP-glucuronate 4-epimerase
MSYFKFTKQIVEGNPIEVYNYGRMKRDFTYIDDVVEAMVRVVSRVPGGDPGWDPDCPDPASSAFPFRIYNVGNSSPVDLLSFVSILEAELGKKAVVRLMPMQRGDVEETCADAGELERDVGFRPLTSLREGLRMFAAWYREHYRL